MARAHRSPGERARPAQAHLRRHGGVLGIGPCCSQDGVTGRHHARRRGRLLPGVWRLRNLAALDSGLGTEWQILHVHYKIYAQDGYIQPMTEALERIVKQHDFALDAIEEVRGRLLQVAHERVAGVIREPTDLASAQYSANFSLALFLVKGGAGLQNTRRTASPTHASSRSASGFARRSTRRSSANGRSAGRAARASRCAARSETYSECVHMLRAMTSDDMEHKIRSLSALAVGADKSERLVGRAQSGSAPGCFRPRAVARPLAGDGPHDGVGDPDVLAPLGRTHD